MTVGELTQSLLQENPDATMQIIDGDKAIEFTGDCLIRDLVRNLVAIDLIHSSCTEIIDNS